MQAWKREGSGEDVHDEKRVASFALCESEVAGVKGGNASRLI